MVDGDNIELRSERTKQIIKMAPPQIVKHGTLIITIIIILLLAASYFVPYSENIEANIVVVSTECGSKINAYIPYSYVYTINVKMKAVIEFEGYPSSEFGYINATITDIDKEPHNINGQNFFTIYMDIQDNKRFKLFIGMKGTVNILISNKSILQKLFNL